METSKSIRPTALLLAVFLSAAFSFGTVNNAEAGLKNWAKKKATKAGSIVKKTTKKAGSTVKKTVKKASRTGKWLAKQPYKGVKRGGKYVSKKAYKGGKWVNKNLKKLCRVKIPVRCVKGPCRPVWKLVPCKRPHSRSGNESFTNTRLKTSIGYPHFCKGNLKRLTDNDRKRCYRYNHGQRHLERLTQNPWQR